MLADSGARLLFVDAGARGDARRGDAGCRARIALDGSAPGRAFDAWLAPAGARAAPVDAAARTGRSTSSIRRAPPARRRASSSRTRCAGRTCSAAAAYGYGPDAVTLLSTPLYSNTTLVVFFPTIASAAPWC